MDGQITVPYRLWGISATPNEGIEGICAAGNSLVAVAEAIVPVELDLSARTENLEGIAWLASGAVAIVEPNFMGDERSGPAKLWVAPLKTP